MFRIEGKTLAAFAACAVTGATFAAAVPADEITQIDDSTVLYHTGYAYCVPGFTYTGKAARLELKATQNTNRWWGTVAFVCDGKGPAHVFSPVWTLRDNYIRISARNAKLEPVPLRPEEIVLEKKPSTFEKSLGVESWKQKLDRIAWWQKDRFGMFIHFGLYALPARHEWYQSTAKVSYADYNRYFRAFNPDRFDARAWARAAKAAGMKYVVLTTKHHDGFCLFDSKYTDYKITNTPFGRDLVREYVDALRAEGLKVGFYYSVRDWHHPMCSIDRTHPLRPGDIADPKNLTPEYFAKLNAGRDLNAYCDYLRKQVRELLTNYGHIDIFWYDGAPRSTVFGENGRRYDWDIDYPAIYRFTHDLQPHLVINDRLTLCDYPDGQDFLSPEQCRSEEPPSFAGREWPWETCQTFSGSWGYYRDEKTWKSTFQILEQLIQTVSCGGNLIMNVGPTGRGDFDGRAQERLADYGRWLSVNGESIYGCGAAPKDLPRIPNTLYTYNAAKKKLYVHFLCWTTGPVALPFADRVAYAQFLHDKSEIQIELDAVRGDRHTLKTPLDKPPVEIPVIELQLK